MIIGDRMTRNVPLLHPEDTIEHCIRLLRKTKLDGLPVVNSRNKLIGIFTKANLMDAYLAGVSCSERLEKHFTCQVVTEPVDKPYAEVEKSVRMSPVGMGVVIDNDTNVLGVFTKVDMIMALFQESEKLASRLNTVYHAMHNGVIIFDSNNRIQYINNSGERILGQKQNKLEGCLLSSVTSNIDLTPVVQDSCHLIGVKARLNGVKSLCNVSPILTEHGADGAIIIFQPLTDLDKVASELESTKRLYETLFTVVNIAYEAIIVVDESARIALVNEAACKFFGKKEPELLAKPVDEILENTRLPRVVKTGMAETNEIQVISGRPYIVSRLPIVRDGKIIGAVGKIVFQGLDEVREVADKLAQMDQELNYYKKKGSTNQGHITFNQIVTVNKDMRQLKQEAELVAYGNSTVMLTGESGTGKELFAQAIHNASRRKGKPFVKVNCAAIPENLLESEFFGYANGAFTGAQKGGKPGKLAVADQGSLFLDEIGDMSLNLQSKILRVLEDKCFEPIGSNQTVSVDVRIIAATNQDLLQKVESGEFRRDLYYRLNVINFKLIPLRNRPEDVIPLAHTYLEKLSYDFGKNIIDLSDGVCNVLLGHHWPGNVRELKNVIERAVNFAKGSLLEVKDLPFYLYEQTEKAQPLKNTGAKEMPEISGSEALDKQTVEKVLERVKGNKSEAAKELGISRSWLYEIMRRYDLC